MFQIQMKKKCEMEKKHLHVNIKSLQHSKISIFLQIQSHAGKIVQTLNTKCKDDYIS